MFVIIPIQERQVIHRGKQLLLQGLTAASAIVRHDRQGRATRLVRVANVVQFVLAVVINQHLGRVVPERTLLRLPRLHEFSGNFLVAVDRF